MDTNGHTILCEDYVSYEVAKLLKEKGFDGVCRYYYPDSHTNLVSYVDCRQYNIFNNESCIAPTLQMACKWLREVYNVVIEINSIWIVGFGYNYIARIVVEGESKKCLKHYNYYEEAVESAIKYVLENLI